MASLLRLLWVGNKIGQSCILRDELKFWIFYQRASCPCSLRLELTISSCKWNLKLYEWPLFFRNSVLDSIPVIKRLFGVYRHSSAYKWKHIVIHRNTLYMRWRILCRRLRQFQVLKLSILNVSKYEMVSLANDVQLFWYYAMYYICIKYSFVELQLVHC